MTVSEGGKQVRNDTFRALQDPLDDQHANSMSDAPAESSPSPSPPTVAQMTVPALLEQALSKSPCSQSNSSADVPETLSDCNCTDSISDEQVFGTIYKLPVPDFKKIDHNCTSLLKRGGSAPAMVTPSMLCSNPVSAMTGRDNRRLSAASN